MAERENVFIWADGQAANEKQVLRLAMMEFNLTGHKTINETVANATGHGSPGAPVFKISISVERVK